MNRDAVLNMIQMYGMSCLLMAYEDPTTSSEEFEEVEIAIQIFFDDLIKYLPSALA